MLRQEMNIAYFDKIHRPGEKLGVLDNGSDFESCAERVHCNATHGGFGPPIVWNEEKKAYELCVDEEKTKAYLEKFNSVLHGKRHTIMGGGEHNNVYFPGFIHYKKNIPEALMQDIDGNYLQLRDRDIQGGEPIPMPAIDDPQIMKLNAQQLAYQAAKLPGSHYVAAYTVGAEMLWPEYFGLGNGDYRPVAWKHFLSWCALQGEEAPSKQDTLVEGSKARCLWLRYREQAMADRAGYYYRAILNEDNTHLCYYPTHGSMMLGSDRARLGQQPDTLAAVTDGIEMGHILIDDDAERRNVILTCLNTSYGTPVIVPRLGNKTADLGMAGGGRSFTPETLRRLVYEDVGMGIHIIFPIHWRSHLHDGEWFIKNTPAESECRKVFDEIITSAPYMMGMGRMQPQVGILASDETWLQEYSMRWTALMQDMLADRANCTIMTDAIIQPGLSKRMPLLLLIDNHTIAEKTMAQLIAYMDEGGKILVWGDFALNSENRLAMLNHQNCLVSKAPACEKQRVIRESFLTGYTDGTWSRRFKVNPLNYEAINQEISRFAPDVILQPFEVVGDAGQTNLYALTDRAGMGCVCINNGREDAVFTVRPDQRLMQNARAIDMLTGKEVQMPITLPGFDTAMIYFAQDIGDDFDDVICEAEDAFQHWRELGMDCGPVRHNFGSIRTGNHYIKRYAMAKALLDSLVLSCQCETAENGDLLIKVDCMDAKGRVADADMTIRMVPGTMRQCPCVWNGQTHVCRIKQSDIAQVYNPDTCDYEALKGAARLIIQAEKAGKQGGCLVNIRI